MLLQTAVVSIFRSKIPESKYPAFDAPGSTCFFAGYTLVAEKYWTVVRASNVPSTSRNSSLKLHPNAYTPGA